MQKMILELQPKTWQTLYKIYKDQDAKDPTAQQLALISHLKTLGFSEALAYQFATFAIYSFSQTDSKEDDNELYIAFSDIHQLKEKLSNETNIDVMKLLLAFIAFSRADTHDMSWVKYDKKIIFYLAGLLNKKPVYKEQLTATLHRKYGLEMQVVGSNQPIPCFKITWLTKATSESGKNPLVAIGPTSPSTISYYLSTMINNNSDDNNNNNNNNNHKEE